MESADNPILKFNAEDGAVPLMVICSATFITGPMVEGRGWATLAREVSGSITVPAAQLFPFHAGGFSVFVGIVKDRDGGDRDGIMGRTARWRRGRFFAAVPRRGRELHFHHGEARLFRGACEVTVRVQLQFPEVTPFAVGRAPSLAYREQVCRTCRQGRSRRLLQWRSLPR